MKWPRDLSLRTPAQDLEEESRDREGGESGNGAHIPHMRNAGLGATGLLSRTGSSSQNTQGA